MRINFESRKQCTDKHDRASDCNSDNHLEGHLNIGNICRHTCNKTGSRKLIDIGKGKLLYLIIDILTQVLCKTR